MPLRPRGRDRGAVGAAHCRLVVTTERRRKQTHATVPF